MKTGGHYQLATLALERVTAQAVALCMVTLLWHTGSNATAQKVAAHCKG